MGGVLCGKGKPYLSCLYLTIKERGQQVSVVWEGRQARTRYTGAFAGHVNTTEGAGMVHSCCSKSSLALLRSVVSPS